LNICICTGVAIYIHCICTGVAIYIHCIHTGVAIYIHCIRTGVAIYIHCISFFMYYSYTRVFLKNARILFLFNKLDKYIFRS